MDDELRNIEVQSNEPENMAHVVEPDEEPIAVGDQIEAPLLMPIPLPLDAGVQNQVVEPLWLPLAPPPAARPGALLPPIGEDDVRLLEMLANLLSYRLHRLLHMSAPNPGDREAMRLRSLRGVPRPPIRRRRGCLPEARRHDFSNNTIEADVDAHRYQPINPIQDEQMLDFVRMYPHRSLHLGDYNEYVFDLYDVDEPNDPELPLMWIAERGTQTNYPLNYVYVPDDGTWTMWSIVHVLIVLLVLLVFAAFILRERPTSIATIGRKLRRNFLR